MYEKLVNNTRPYYIGNRGIVLLYDTLYKIKPRSRTYHVCNQFQIDYHLRM